MEATRPLPVQSWPGPRPVVLLLGSGRLATSLRQAMGIEAFHTLHAQTWAEVRALSGFLHPDVIVQAIDKPEEQAWLGCFAADVPCLEVAPSPGPDGLAWPLRWSAFLDRLNALAKSQREPVAV